MGSEDVVDPLGGPRNFGWRYRWSCENYICILFWGFSFSFFFFFLAFGFWFLVLYIQYTLEIDSIEPWKHLGSLTLYVSPLHIRSLYRVLRL